MKTPLSFCLTLFFLLAASFKTDDAYTSRLCKSNEKVIFSFIVAGSKKVVTVCKDKSNNYIVYRYGTKDNIELQYPENPDEKSWNLFMFYYVGREGSVKEAAFEMSSFSFVNKGLKYDVYYNRRAEDATNDVGVMITGDGKETTINGDLKTQIGALQNLRLEKNIQNSATGE